MKSPASSSFVASAQLFKRMTTVLAACMFVVTVGCAETDDPAEQADAALSDSSVSPSLPSYDSSFPSSFDAGTVIPTWGADSATPVADSSIPVSSDAGSVKADAAAPAADGGLMIPDLGGLFPSSDAGPAPTPPDAGAGARDVNGPCKNLNLICFDFVDMWINAECATCNSGKGCQGCAIPFAY